MIKFIAQANELTLYGFGLTNLNLDSMEEGKVTFFDFEYADHPELFGLIFYAKEYKEPEDIAANLPAVLEKYCLPFLNEEKRVTIETLRVFAFPQSIMQKFREDPYWGFPLQVEITKPGDQQLIFAGPDEYSIEQYLKKSGVLTKSTEKTYRGFGKSK